jgi:hypothetical protein
MRTDLESVAAHIREDASMALLKLEAARASTVARSLSKPVAAQNPMDNGGTVHPDSLTDQPESNPGRTRDEARRSSRRFI